MTSKNSSINLSLLGDDLHIETDIIFQEVSIYSIIGEPLINQSNYHKTINVANLPTGCYILVLRDKKIFRIQRNF